jgi:YfiH family protein
MNPTKKLELIIPDWPAPQNIVAYTTTRVGGVSQAPYDTFNLGRSAGDTSEAVAHNREHLRQHLKLPNEPAWLEQTHTTKAILIDADYQCTNADASFTTEADQVCVVLTADCLPLLICDQAGTTVAAIHAGWRGLANGVIENTLTQLGIDGAELLAWLGPGIGSTVYEVGDDVRDTFLAHDSAAEQAFMRNDNQRWLADIYLLARQRLNKLSVSQIYGGDYCTYSQRDKFYSFRRDGMTGRMATLIYRRGFSSDSF